MSISADYIFVSLAEETLGPLGPCTPKFLIDLLTEREDTCFFHSQRHGVTIQQVNTNSVLGIKPRGVGLIGT